MKFKHTQLHYTVFTFSTVHTSIFHCPVTCAADPCTLISLNIELFFDINGNFVAVS